MAENLAKARFARIEQESKKTTMTRVGLQMFGNLSFEAWENVGHRLSSMVDSTTWCLGDWLVYGKNHFPDRYEIAIRSVGLKYQTLRNYAWVSRRFDIDRRRVALSFQHHAEVASLPRKDQDQWLDEAQREKWTTKMLRTRIRDMQLQSEDDDAPPLPPVEIANIRIGGNRVPSWREAASKVGMDFEKWVTITLDQAATQALTVRPAL